MNFKHLKVDILRNFSIEKYVLYVNITLNSTEMALSSNWITEKLIDFEYKKYVLLAFLKEVNEQFEENKLYPPLSELISHYKQVVSIKENKENLLNSFPQKLSTIDLENFKITYERMMSDNDVMKEIEDIINFSIPKFEYYLSEGKKIYDSLEEQISIEPIGLLPLNREEGYMLINNNNETKVFEYRISIFEHPNIKYRGIHTEYVRSFAKNISNTFESIKTDLIRENASMPNPAAFAIESEKEIPFEETFFPIAKRTLVKFVSSIS